MAGGDRRHERHQGGHQHQAGRPRHARALGGNRGRPAGPAAHAWPPGTTASPRPPAPTAPARGPGAAACARPASAAVRARPAGRGDALADRPGRAGRLRASQRGAYPRAQLPARASAGSQPARARAVIAEPAQADGDHRQEQEVGEGLRGEVVLPDPVAQFEHPRRDPDHPPVRGEGAGDEQDRAEPTAGRWRPVPRGVAERRVQAAAAGEEGVEREEAGPALVNAQHATEVEVDPVVDDVVHHADVLPGPGVAQRPVNDGGRGVQDDDQGEQVRPEHRPPARPAHHGPAEAHHEQRGRGPEGSGQDRDQPEASRGHHADLHSAEPEDP